MEKWKIKDLQHLKNEYVLGTESWSQAKPFDFPILFDSLLTISS